MKFYRPLGTVRAMSFDLDDTLYDNTPVLLRAEQILLEYLHTAFPESQSLALKDWFRLRSEAIKQNPRLAHNVTESRLAALRSGLTQSGYSETEARQGAQQAFELLLEARHEVPVPAETHQVLAQLARQIPLVAITNGNADVQRIGLGDYFTFALRAEEYWASKPGRTLFQVASSRLKLAPEQILHIGDHLTSDVFGAMRSGYQACWINPQRHCLRRQPKAPVMPHVEIRDLTELLALI